MKKLTIFLILLISAVSFSQRTCGKDEYMKKVFADPVLKQEYLEKQAAFEIEYQRLLAIEADYQSRGMQSPTITRVIPVAVHFPSVSNSSSASVKTCLRNLAQSQINVINADYNAANTDISNWTAASAFYPGVTTGNLDVQFVLSNQNHPAGTGLTNGTLAVTFGTDFLNGADSDATWAGYMNFVVRDEGSQTLGYSPYPGTPSAGQTVVMNTYCFGKGVSCSGYVPQSPFNLGRTVTHELGHFFNLDHTFGSCGTNCATTGDRVCDTPAVLNETYGCPTNGSVNGCVSGQKALTMNYMDYVDDAYVYVY